MQRSLRPKPDLNGLRTALHAKVLRHDAAYGLSTLFFGDGELRVPLVQAPVGTGVRVMIDARDVSIALSRPMDVSITNRLPGNDRCYRAARVALCAGDV